jgi:hypothetical protein
MTAPHTLKRFPLLASVASDRTLRIWKLSSHGATSTITTLRARDELFACHWNPSGTCLALAGREGTVEIINAETATSQRSYAGHSRPICALAWSPDGTRIASGGRDQTIHVWDPTTGALLCTYHGHTNLVTTLAFSPDSRYLASGSWDGTAQVWSVTDGKHLTTLHAQPKDQIFSVAWSPNGNTLAVAGTDVRLYHWDCATDETHLACQYDEHNGVVYAVAWSPDGYRLASGSFDGTVHIWEADQGKRLEEHQHTGWVRAIAWDPSGQYIASGGRDMQVHVWHADSGRLFSTYCEHQGVVYSVSWTLSPLASPPSKIQQFPFQPSPRCSLVAHSQAPGSNGHPPAQQASSPRYLPPRYVPPPLVSPPTQSLPTSPKRQAQPPRKAPAKKRHVPPGSCPPASKRPARHRPLPVRAKRPRRLTPPVTSARANPSPTPLSPCSPASPKSAQAAFSPAPGCSFLVPQAPPLPSPYVIPPTTSKPFHFPWSILLFLVLPFCLSPAIWILLAYILAFFSLFVRVVFHFWPFL